MRKGLGGAAMGLAAVLWFLGQGETAWAAPADGVALTVSVVNGAGVPQVVLEQAEKQAAEIFSRVGVLINWKTSGASVTMATVSRPYILNIVPKPLSSGGDDANDMGTAPSAGKPGAHLAYAFYGVIETVARRHDINVADLLADVIAHELGHLLLPFPSHSASGIMYGTWDAGQLRLAAQRALRFSSAQGTLVRSHIAQDQK